jgi:hypothetical protein
LGGVAADVWVADEPIVAGSTGAGSAGVVGTGVDTKGDGIVDDGAESPGMSICGAGWAGCNSTMAVASEDQPARPPVAVFGLSGGNVVIIGRLVDF